MNFAEVSEGPLSLFGKGEVELWWDVHSRVSRMCCISEKPQLHPGWDVYHHKSIVEASKLAFFHRKSDHLHLWSWQNRRSKPNHNVFRPQSVFLCMNLIRARAQRGDKSCIIGSGVGGGSVIGVVSSGQLSDLIFKIFSDYYNHCFLLLFLSTDWRQHKLILKRATLALLQRGICI